MFKNWIWFVNTKEIVIWNSKNREQIIYTMFIYSTIVASEHHTIVLGDI